MNLRSLLVLGALLLPLPALQATEKPTEPDIVVVMQVDAQGIPQRVDVEKTCSAVSTSMIRKFVKTKLQAVGAAQGDTIRVSLSAEQVLQDTWRHVDAIPHLPPLRFARGPVQEPRSFRN